MLDGQAEVQAEVQGGEDADGGGGDLGADAVAGEYDDFQSVVPLSAGGFLMPILIPGLTL